MALGFGCCELRFGEGGDALERSLHLGMVAIHRGVVGVGRNEILRAAHMWIRENGLGIISPSHVFNTHARSTAT